MRRHTSGGFFLCLIINLILNIHLAFPGVALLILRIWFPIPLWAALAVLGLWFVGPLVMTLLFVFMRGLASKEELDREAEHHNKQREKHKESEELLAAFNAKKKAEKEKRMQI